MRLGRRNSGLWDSFENSVSVCLMPLLLVCGGALRFRLEGLAVAKNFQNILIGHAEKLDLNPGV